MKKLLSMSLSFLILLSSTTGISFAESANTTLSKAISKSFSKDYIQLELEGNISYGESELSFMGDQIYDKDKINEYMSIDLDIDGKDVKKIFGETKFDFLLLSANLESYFDSKKLDIFFKLSDTYIDIKTKNENIKAVAEGGLEVVEMFSGKYYYFSLESLIDFYEEEGVISNDEIIFLKSYLSNLSKKEGVEFFTTLIDAKVFKSKKVSSKKYSLKLNEDISDIDFSKIIEKIGEKKWGKEIAKEMKKNLENITDEELERMQKSYDQFLNFFDFTLYFNLNNSGYISRIDQDFRILSSTFIGNDITSKVEAKITYNKKLVTLPEKDTSEVVDFSKIFKMGQAINNLNDYGNDDYLYDNYDYDNTAVPPFIKEETKVEAVILEEYSIENDWYLSALKRINNDGFYFKNNFIPDNEISKYDFNYYLDAIQTYYYYTKLKNEPQYNGGEKINKLTGISFIVKKFFPKAKNPIKFAIKTGILSDSFSPKNAMSKNLTNAEFVYIVDNIIGKYALINDTYFKSLSQKEIENIKRGTYINGSSDAEITWIEYSDLDCPYCKKLHNDGTIDKILKHYDGKVNVIFKNFPLDFHKNSKEKSEAILCAGELGGDDVYYSFIEGIFSNEKVDLLEIAKNLGLNISKFEKCLESDKFLKRIESEILEGKNLFNVTGTPGNVLINNKTGNWIILPGAYPISSFKEKIDYLLK